ncbi:UNVERIFIED_ORG: hypothetical protein J2W64_001853 [Rahnella aquatilis]|uniref:CRISPR-associated endonuclease Cas2 n=1 Tax=Rahnella sp. 2050 TaxID=3156425 RepID=UPI001B4F7D83|nr:hypothetical protein [Rahnella aquatilis]
MPTYIISYDLRKPGRNYDELYKAIKNYPNWAKVNESVWAVVSAGSAVQVRDFIMKYVDANDSVFVIKSGLEAAWHNTICESAWLKKNL